MRAMVGLICIGFPSAYCGSPDNDMSSNIKAYIDKGVQIHEQVISTMPLVTTCIAPHAPYTVSTCKAACSELEHPHRPALVDQAYRICHAHAGTTSVLQIYRIQSAHTFHVRVAFTYHSRVAFTYHNCVAFTYSFHFAHIIICVLHICHTSLAHVSCSASTWLLSEALVLVSCLKRSSTLKRCTES